MQVNEGIIYSDCDFASSYLSTFDLLTYATGYPPENNITPQKEENEQCFREVYLFIQREVSYLVPHLLQLIHCSSTVAIGVQILLLMDVAWKRCRPGRVFTQCVGAKRIDDVRLRHLHAQGAQHSAFVPRQSTSLWPRERMLRILQMRNSWFLLRRVGKRAYRRGELQVQSKLGGC